MILILSAENDDSVQMVVPELVKRGAEFLWWDPGGYPARTTMSSRLTGGSWRHTLRIDGRAYDCSRFTAIWNRHPTHPQAPEPVTDANHRKYVEKLATILLRGWEHTVESRWLPARTMDILR
ncbi:MvdC/MvdD family ATP grasp protein, partial [Nonomuraea sp. NPDC023979]|uniref:MvdC/MvdD family ATP grasp protein n=1 Tax=Nonomuraea sp. NPDC023979 TaxID=3154796 RepID=UPI003405F91D